MTHLIFHMYDAYRSGIVGHPQSVMKKLGISYQHSVPQSMTDTWEFWNCENVPDNLPPGLEKKDWNPMDRIGWGLSQEMAENIRDCRI